LLVPLGAPLRGGGGARRERAVDPEPDEQTPEREEPVDVAAELAALGATEVDEPAAAEAAPGPLSLPFARRDLDRLRLILFAQRRLREVDRPAATKQLVASRAYFDEALRWLEIHGGADGAPLAAHWRSLDLGDVPPPALPALEREPRFAEPPARAGNRRRRRRRRRRGPAAPPSSARPE
jgi:hypothetical protein